MPEDNKEGKKIDGGWAEENQPEEREQAKSQVVAKLNELIGVLKVNNEIQKGKTTAIVKATEAMNALLTTLVGQSRKELPDKTQIPPTNIIQKTEGTPLPEPEPSTGSITDQISNVKMMFTEDLENLLSFEEKEDYIKIKPRQFLGSENFAKIASIVRGIGGDYVSAGKESHFRVSKKAE